MYELPQALRADLKPPMGPVRSSTDAVDAAKDVATLVAVGDIVTGTFLDAGLVPNVMIVDGRTERGPVEEDPLRHLPGEAKRIPTENPPARITADLWRALVAALASDHPTVIDVDGEEDLATLPAILLAPLGALVAYGQPSEGVVTVEVTEEARTTVRRLLAKMEAT